MKEVEKEIRTVETLIEILEKSLFMHMRSLQLKEAKNTFRDIQTCKKELRRLIEKKESETESPGEQTNAAI